MRFDNLKEEMNGSIEGRLNQQERGLQPLVLKCLERKKLHKGKAHF
jgi:hypothetical protein